MCVLLPHPCWSGFTNPALTEAAVALVGVHAVQRASVVHCRLLSYSKDKNRLQIF